MGLLKGTAGWVTFRLENKKTDDWREVFADSISRNQHVENLFARSKEPNIGWADVRDPGHVSLKAYDWLLDSELIVLGLRVDKKSVNGKMLNVQLERKVLEVMEEHKREHDIGKKWRNEIKETLEEELLYHQTPTLAMHDVAWRLEPLPDGQQRLYVFSTSDSVLDLVAHHFKETFGLLPCPDRFVEWLMASPKWTEGTICEARNRIWADGFQLSFPEDELPWRHKDLLKTHYAELCSDFLMWLWYAIDSSNGTFKIDDGPYGGYDVWLESKVSLLDGGQKVTLSGDHSSQSQEAMSALAQGRRPNELQLGVKMAAADDDEKFTFSLKHHGSIVRISGAKLRMKGGNDKGDEEGSLLIRMNEVEELQGVVEALFCRFFGERADMVYPFKKRLSDWIEKTIQDGPKKPVKHGQEDPNQVTLGDSIARAAAQAGEAAPTSTGEDDGVEVTLHGGMKGRVVKVKKETAS